MSAPERIERGVNPRGVFQPAQNEAGQWRNLVWHSLLVLDPEYQEHREYPKMWPVVPAADDRLRAGKLAAQFDVLCEAIHVASNGVDVRTPNEPGPAGLFDLSRLFRRVMEDLRRRTDERSGGVRRHVRELLEKALTRFPTAFCWYAYEVFEAAGDKAALLSHLAIATTHASCAEEFECVRAAHIWAVEILQRRWRQEPSIALARVAAKKNYADSGEHLTRSQKEVLESCVALGEIFYGSSEVPLSVTPRVFSLIVAPTGSGKTHLVRSLARRLRADLVRIQRSNYIVQGARGRPTVYRICEQLVRRPAGRVLVHIDELDKFSGERGAVASGSDWGVSTMGDIFDCLAGDFPVDNFCADEGDKHGAKVTPAELRERARKLVYIVGSGTFQSVFDSAKKRSVGFGNQPNGEADFEAIVASGIVSRELLARFHAPAFVLRAPTVDEVRELYERNGLAQLAREVSYTFTAADYDLQRTGFRSVESLATKLLLLRRKRILAAAAELPTPPPLSLSR